MAFVSGTEELHVRVDDSLAAASRHEASRDSNFREFSYSHG